jgi:hypothetical protein
MAETKIYSLETIKSGTDTVEFLSAEVLSEFRIPLVLVLCRLPKKKTKCGLRLDMDKKAFLDVLDDDEADFAISKSAPSIVQYLYETIYK